MEPARGVAQAAAGQPDVFTTHRAKRDFIDQLRAAITELEEAIRVRVESRGYRTIANEAVAGLVRRGAKAVAMLDAMIEPRLDDTRLLLAWRSVKRPMEPGGSSDASGEEDLTTPDEKAA